MISFLLNASGEAVIWSASAAHRVARTVAPWACPMALVADRILGPAEEFTYVSTTAPSSPPPT